MPTIRHLAAEAVEMLKAMGTIKAAADRLGKPPSTISYRLKRAKALGLWDGDHDNPRTGKPEDPQPDEGVTSEESKGSLNVRVVSATIDTKDKAITHSGIDLALWYEAWYQFRSYQVIRRQDTEPVQLRSFAFRFKRRVPIIAQQAAEGLIERIQRHAPVYPKRSNSRKRRIPAFALEFSPFDAHFGKLAWARETGDNYDLKIAERLFSGALDYTLAALPPGDCERFIFPVGSDFFHIDSLDATTTAGTPQDTDGRFGKIFETGMMACVHAVDRMLSIAPVRVVWVPGNHDWLSSFHLANFLDAWYRNCKAVTVDKGPSPRKYVEYGMSLIGFCHGNEEKHSSLPAIMATEQPEAWARTKRHEWHLGHQHRRRSTEHTAVDSYEGVTVRTLPSLSGRDAWHHKKGYIGTRAAESYIWSKQHGYLGHIEAPVEAL